MSIELLDIRKRTMKKNVLRRIIALTLLSVSLSFASTQKPTQNYAALSTEKLQQIVEELSNQGKLPFELGVELIKRWSNA